MSNTEVIRLLDLIAGLANNPEPQDGCRNIVAYCQMMKEQLLNQMVELQTPLIQEKNK